MSEVPLCGQVVNGKKMSDAEMKLHSRLESNREEVEMPNSKVDMRASDPEVDR